MSVSDSGDGSRPRHPAGPQPDNPILSDDEILGLSHGLRAGPGSRSFEADLHDLASWALTARIDCALVELVLAGELLVLRQASGDWGFRLTPAAATRGAITTGGHR